MSKVLKKLYLGDVVKSFGTKQLRKLTTEEPTESIVGTWVFNDIIVNDVPDPSIYNINFISSAWKFTEFKSITLYSTNNTVWFKSTTDSSFIVYNHTGRKDNWSGVIQIIDGADISNQSFITWLKANATKQ